MSQRTSPRSAPGDWGAEADAEGRLRRALLRAARGEILQDRIDCAELAFRVGLRDIASILYGLVFLQLGFSAAGRAFQKEVGNRTGLWDALPPGLASAAGARGFSVDLAVAELRALMRLEPALLPLPGGFEAILPMDASADVLAWTEPKPAPADRLARLCARASAALRSIPRLAENGGLAEVLRALADEALATRLGRLEDHLDAEIDRFASLFALDGLRRFLAANHDLLHVLPPEPALFEKAARLDPGALGPYFANVRMVIRDVRDIFAMVDAAAERRPARDDVECWCVLLSAHLPRGEALDFIEELGDRGMTRALRHILVRTVRSSPVEQSPDIARRIRDAALDIGDFPLAADAQQSIALSARTDPNEWKILGEVRAAAENRAGAAEAFARAVALDPSDRDRVEQLLALRSGKRFELVRGYETSVGRYRLRRARLEAFAKAG